MLWQKEIGKGKERKGKEEIILQFNVNDEKRKEREREGKRTSPDSCETTEERHILFPNSLVIGFSKERERERESTKSISHRLSEDEEEEEKEEEKL